MKSTIAAVIGGVVGALIWGAISYFTGYEVGYVAWGIGALIGFLCAASGGGGMSDGAVCAVIAVLSLVGGKYLAVQMSLDKELKPIFEPAYELQKAEAQEFVKLNTDEELKQFMVENGYTDATSSTSVRSVEFDEFERTSAPLLLKLSDGMSYDEYQDEMVAQMGGVTKIVKDGIGGIDVVFFLLGIYTAFKIGSGGEEESTEPQGLG